MDGKIPYFHEYREDNRTYSIDMITIKATVKHGCMNKLYDFLEKRVTTQGGKPKLCTAPNRYHWFFTICYDLCGMHYRCAAKYELGQNEYGGTIKEVIKIQLNPNKLFGDFNLDHEKALTDLAIVYELIRDVEIKSYDLAIDIGVPRPSVCIMPFAKRLYRRYDGTEPIQTVDGIAIHNADDYTEYVGKHNEHGFVKVYNKQVECRLAYPCTRVELTVVPAELKQDYRWTPIKVLDVGQMEIQEDIGTKDDKLLAKLILMTNEVDKYLSLIQDKRKSQKIKALVMAGYKDLAIDINASWFKSIVAEISKYVNGDIIKNHKKHHFRPLEDEVRLECRRKFTSKYYKLEDGKRYYVCDFNEEQLLTLSDEDFNEGVRYFLALEDMTEELENYKPYHRAYKNEQDSVVKRIKESKQFVQASDEDLAEIVALFG